MMRSVTAVPTPRVSLARCYALEGRLEFVRLLRSPAFAVPTLLFPPMFYLLFGVLLTRGGGESHANVYLLATYSVFGVMMPGLFGFGVSVALDRERGWLTLKRAQPMPAGAYLAAKLMMAMLFAAIIFSILATIAATVGGARLPLGAWTSLLAVDVLGVLPFCALGLAIGTCVNGQGAPAIINLIYLPMSFLSGLWMPLSVLPAVVGEVAPLWPPYHLSQLALAAVGLPVIGSLPAHVGVLAAYTIGFLAIARHRLARSQ
jgi:ABC-2 type transport system permease protein